MRRIDKPAPGEYPAYAQMYIRLLPDDGLLLRHFSDNLKATTELMRLVPEDKLTYRYAPGKWTIKDILLHIIDDERIYAYRALRFARNDQTPLPGFEQDDYVRYANADTRTVDDLLAEFTTVRNATISLFAGLPSEAFTKSGIANTNKVSVRALAYHIAGHELHHIHIIKERYLY
jgi:uncharacterized damage-inducible protein DinB